MYKRQNFNLDQYKQLNINKSIRFIMRFKLICMVSYHWYERLMHLNTLNKKRFDRVKTEHLFVKIKVLTWGKCSSFYHSWSWTNVSQQSEHVSTHIIFIKSFEVFTITVQIKKKTCCLAVCLQKGYSTYTFTNTNYTAVMCLLYFIH